MSCANFKEWMFEKYGQAVQPYWAEIPMKSGGGNGGEWKQGKNKFQFSIKCTSVKE